MKRLQQRDRVGQKLLTVQVLSLVPWSGAALESCADKKPLTSRRSWSSIMTERKRESDQLCDIHCTTDSYLDWHVAKHDVYGEQFCTSWEAADEDHEDMDDFNLDELHDALDDAALIDE
ncbi:Proline rich antigen 2 [Phytophthora cinnamomi]|uniref:Proline rich antigen 2 n=1 Tax=Phytophthora cinnamomi TaxID=4785 RepID=UPI00355A7C25|nr:Proline rich antigen 2 [Phytophthora cinnamomi]